MQQNTDNRKSETMQEAMQSSSRYIKRNMLWTALIIIGFFAYSMLSSPAMSVVLKDDMLSITMPDRTTRVIYHEEIISCDLVENVEYGSMITGAESNKCWYGQWQNELWGEYTLCVHPLVSKCLVLHLADAVVVINATTDDETQTWYISLNSASQTDQG